MIVGSFGYTIEAIQNLTVTESAFISTIVIGLLVIVTIAKLSVAFWLIVKGMSVEKWRAIAGTMTIH